MGISGQDSTDANDNAQVVLKDDANVSIGQTASIPLQTSDILDGGGNQASLTVGTSAIEAKVGGSALANRKHIILQPKDNSVYFGLTSGVTTVNGTRLFKNQTIFIPAGPNSTVYLIADGAGKTVQVIEVA